METEKSTLIDLATKYGTDKWGSHYYAQHYDSHFSKFRDQSVNILEIGVGGYEDPQAGGESLRMWKEYFHHGNIYAIDIFDKSGLQEERINIYQGSQVDDDFLEGLLEKTGDLDIIVDDGSHINEHIIETFKLLFPRLKKGGIYAVEDLQTSYWKNYGGNSFNLRKKGTAMNFFKTLADSLNYEEIDNPYYEPNYFDLNIVAIHFYHNMVFIEKGENTEGSNLIVNNMRPTKRKTQAKIKYFLRNLKARLFGKSARF